MYLYNRISCIYIIVYHVSISLYERDVVGVWGKTPNTHTHDLGATAPIMQQRFLAER